MIKKQTKSCNVVEETSNEEAHDGLSELNHITAISGFVQSFESCSIFVANVTLNGHKEAMEVDSGAAYTIVSEELWNKIARTNQTLKKFSAVLRTWSISNR